MKKYFKIVLMFILSIDLIGCTTNNKEEANGYTPLEKETNTKRIVTCELEKEDKSNSYKLSTAYELTVENDLVLKNKIKETITSANKDVLDYFENYMKTTYKTMNDKYGGYSYKVSNDGKKVISTTVIDYTKTNIEKIKEEDSSMKLMTNSNNQVTLVGIKSVYNTLGIECDD